MPRGGWSEVEVCWRIISQPGSKSVCVSERASKRERERERERDRECVCV